MATNGSDSFSGGDAPAATQTPTPAATQTPTPAAFGIDVQITRATIISFLFVVLLLVLLRIYVRYLAAHEALGGRERVAALLGVVGAAGARGDHTTPGGERDGVLSGLPRLNSVTIEGLPAFVYHGGGGEVAADCAVCLGAMEEGERARTLPNCGHVFHVGCIDTWLRVHSTCPLCRQNAHPGNKEAVESTPPSSSPPPPPAAHGVEEGNRESESD